MGRVGSEPTLRTRQLSRDRTAGRFPLAIWERTTLRNGEVSVAFRAVDGSIEQVAGLVWRYADSNNYYVVRANALENNVVLHKVENCVRLAIAGKGLPSRFYAVKREVPRGRWNTLRVSFHGGLLTVFLNGERLFEAEDHTFTETGENRVLDQGR